MNVITFKCRF